MKVTVALPTHRTFLSFLGVNDTNKPRKQNASSQNCASMADFPPYKSEVDQIIAEAMYHCVLEQVAAINCSSFSHSVLPSHLENRFQKLKTFPSSDKYRLGPDSGDELRKSDCGGVREGISGNSPHVQSKVSKISEPSGVEEGKMCNSLSGQLKVSNFEGGSGGGEGKKGNSLGGNVSSPSDSSSGQVDSPKLKGRKQGRRDKMGNSQPGSGSCCSDSEEESERKGGGGGGCLCFYPKIGSRNDKVKNGCGELGFGRGKDESDFGWKEEKKRMKEEEKINKEAEKIVKWAKQVSARMDFGDELSSDDDLNSVHHFDRRH